MGRANIIPRGIGRSGKRRASLIYILVRLRKNENTKEDEKYNESSINQKALAGLRHPSEQHESQDRAHKFGYTGDPCALISHRLLRTFVTIFYATANQSKIEKLV